MLTIEMMRSLWPHGNAHVPGLMEGIVAAAPAVFGKYSSANNPVPMAHFMAQISHECGAGLEMLENMNYSAQGLMNTWPRRFGPRLARKYAHNPQMIAESVYGGRMGNAPPPSHDGWLYRGHGLTQLTGREDYEKVGKIVDLDLIDSPELVSDPDHALLIAMVDFVEICHCLEPAIGDDVLEVTKRLNGGTIGLTERKQWLVKWKHALGAR